jgi:hypothetical protein
MVVRLERSAARHAAAALKFEIVRARPPAGARHSAVLRGRILVRNWPAVDER